MCSEPRELEMRTWTFERTYFSLAKGERERKREREQLKIHARTTGYPFNTFPSMDIAGGTASVNRNFFALGTICPRQKYRE